MKALAQLGARGMAGALLLGFLMGAWAESDRLPPAAPYLGEIRRDATGRLIAIPTVEKSDTHPTPVADGRVLAVGPARPYATIAAAARDARDGDTVEIAAGDYFADVAVWSQRRLILRGVGGRPRLVAAGAAAEGKAIWVIRGGEVTVENLEFVGARVPDRNGAGIRFEKGHLTIRNCRFLDNEMGILTGNDPTATLVIENSEFGHTGDGSGFSHNLYIGTIGSLRVSGSYFHHARRGHLLKTRAMENFILYNRLTDETGGRASYELEFPNGGLAYVIGNIIAQSSTSENATMISFGAEGYKHPKNELYLINNTLHDELPQGGFFLRVYAGADRVKAYNNLLLGQRSLNSGGIDGEFVNNRNVGKEHFVLAERQDYRIRRESPLHRSYVAPGEANGFPLAPQREYVHPATTRPLPGTPTLPGAKQTLEPDGA